MSDLVLSTHEHLVIPPERITEAAGLIQRGGLVAFPTETVYGLGANALDEHAVLSIFQAKGRPLTDPLIVHVSDSAMALRYLDLRPAAESEERAVFDALAAAFWPGPLTVITKAAAAIPLTVTAGTGLVGMRCPAHPLALELIKAAGLPIAAPSANRFGHVSPTTAAHVLSDLGEKGVHVLYGDDEATGMKSRTCEHGIESTVLRIEDPLKQVCILRQGAITHLQLEKALTAFPRWKVTSMARAVDMHKQLLQQQNLTDTADNQAGDSGGQIAPGQAITHYAPDVPCVIVTIFTPSSSSSSSSSSSTSLSTSATCADGILEISWQSLKQSTVVIDFHGGLKASLQQCQSNNNISDPVEVLAYRDLSPSGDTAEAARNLFHALRWSELIPSATRVLLPCVLRANGDVLDYRQATLTSDNDILLGLADRMFRAASGRQCVVVVSE